MNQKFKKAFILRTCGLVLAFISLILATILFMVWIFSMSYQSSDHTTSNTPPLVFAIIFIIVGLVLAIVCACFEKRYKALREENDQQFIRTKVYELKSKLSIIETRMASSNATSNLYEEKKQIENQIYYYQHNYLSDLAAKRAKRAAILTAVAAGAATATASAASAFEKGYRSGRDNRKSSKI